MIKMVGFGDLDLEAVEYQKQAWASKGRSRLGDIFQEEGVESGK
jgi:hypothetical protein